MSPRFQLYEDSLHRIGLALCYVIFYGFAVRVVVGCSVFSFTYFRVRRAMIVSIKTSLVHFYSGDA